MYAKYKDKGLRILAFPCNQFGSQVSSKNSFIIYLYFLHSSLFQEPKSEPEIKEFVKQYNVEFDMFSKINVNGDEAHPLFKFLKKKCGGTFGSFIKWNFTKFLVDKNGNPVKRYAPNFKPLDIEKDIINLLNSKTDVKEEL